jgi:F-type H+-transporting ATPase subunit b
METETTVTDPLAEGAPAGELVQTAPADPVIEDAVITDLQPGAEIVAGAGDVVPAVTPVGMPQLDFSTFPNQIFWLLVTLVVIYMILTRVSLPRIGAILAERQGTITNDLGAAEELRTRASEAETAYEKALADARAQASRIIAETKAEIQADLDVELRKADAEIAARAAESEKAIGEIRDSAMENVAAVAKDTAAALVAALGTAADAATIDAAVDAKMKG